MSDGAGDAGIAADGLAPYPPRPYVPPVLCAMVAVVVSQSLVMRGITGAELPVMAGLGVAIASAALGAARGRGRAGLALVGCCVAVASLLAAARLGSIDRAAEELGRTPASSLLVSVTGDATESVGGWFARGRALRDGRPVGDVWLTVPERPEFGETLSVIGRFTPNGTDEWGRSSRSRGVCGRIKAVRVVGRDPAGGLLGALVGLRSWAIRMIDPSRSPARALMAGVLVSDRVELKAQGVEDVFSTAGLSHLIAVSGSHLVVVGSTLEATLLALGAGVRARSAGVALVSGLYVVLCACPASAVRSWVMLVAALGGKAVGRRSHAPSGMALTGLAMCLADPACACDLGFVLSALSVCALSLFAPSAQAVLARVLPHGRLVREARRALYRARPRLARRCDAVGEALSSTLAASLVCQAATLPACAVTFGTVSLVAPLANVVVGPLFGPIVSLGVLACGVAWVPIVGEAAFLGIEGLCQLSVWLTSALARLPLACVPLAVPPAAELLPIGLGAAWLLAWPQPSAIAARSCVGLAAALAGSLVLWLYVLVPVRLVVLDVGQGDALLVRDGTRCVLVDTGPGDAVVEALARQHVLSIDAVVITHLHDDHTGGLDALEGVVRVGRVYVGEGVADSTPEALRESVVSLTGEGPREIRAGDSLRVGSAVLTCLWPREPRSGGENEDSVCLRLEARRGAASLTSLLTGDAEREVLGEVVGEAGDVDALKVGHHGSAASISADEARALAPEVSVASAGEGNSYGHPTEECVTVLEDAGSEFLCTIDHGDVTIEPGVAGPVVSVSR